MPTPRNRRRYSWARFSDQELLDLRFSQLELGLSGSPIERRVERLYRELDARGLAFRPHVWFSTEWFSPLGVPGIAVPFYLAHARLTRLERRLLLSVEGGAEAQCMQILRHEAGHAIDSAFSLRRRKRYRQLFGSSSRPYPALYRPRPGSRHHVLHLDDWYAQAHPLEDFAETFAVWLKPGSRWRTLYADWPAFKKLSYVDELMGELAGRNPRVRSREQPDRLARVRQTLREHYAERRARLLGSDAPSIDRQLRLVFSGAPEDRDNPSAASFLRRMQPKVRAILEARVRDPRYAIDQAIGDLIERSRELNLRLPTRERQARTRDVVRLTLRTLRDNRSSRTTIAV